MSRPRSEPSPSRTRSRNITTYPKAKFGALYWWYISLRFLNMLSNSTGWQIWADVKKAVLCDVATCGVIINRRFGGTCRLHPSKWSSRWCFFPFTSSWMYTLHAAAWLAIIKCTDWVFQVNCYCRWFPSKLYLVPACVSHRYVHVAESDSHCSVVVITFAYTRLLQSSSLRKQLAHSNSLTVHIAELAQAKDSSASLQA
jgi:hypothetical protein